MPPPDFETSGGCALVASSPNSPRITGPHPDPDALVHTQNRVFLLPFVPGGLYDAGAVTSSLVNNTDIALLSDEAVARIAAGEQIHAVLASMVDPGLSLQPYIKKSLALPPAASEEG